MKKLLLSVALFFVWVAVLYLIPVDLGIDKKSELNKSIDTEVNYKSIFSGDINSFRTQKVINNIDPNLCNINYNLILDKNMFIANK
jgi:hypothetical protein